MSPPVVGVIGATGTLGRQVIPRLIERNYGVRALCRTEGKARQFGCMDIRIEKGDLFTRETLAPFLLGCDVVVNLASSVPRPGQVQDWSTNDKLRRLGTENLISACKEAKVPRIVQQSIAMLQASEGDDWADEFAPPGLTPITRSAWDMEQYIRGAPLEWVILRGGLHYGVGTGRDQAWRDAARQGTLTTPGDGRRFVSLIHVTDMAEAVARAATGPTNRTLAIVDDRPVRYIELFNYIAALENVGPPSQGGAEMLNSFRVPNSQSREAIGWAPHFRTFQSGLALSSKADRAE